MPRYEELPEIFAMLDGTIPFKVSIFKTSPNIEARYQKVKYHYTSLFNSHSAEIYSFSSPELLSWDIWCGSKKERTTFWNTGYMIKNNGITPEDIPIYDFVDRDLLTVNMGCSPYPIYNISSVDAAIIYRKMREVRAAMYPVDSVNQLTNHINLEERAISNLVLPTHTYEQKIPNHVLAALIRSAIADSSACPISMSDFSDVREFGVTSCFHIFEKESIDQWMTTNKNCPECRAPCTNISYYKK